VTEAGACHANDTAALGTDHAAEPLEAKLTIAEAAEPALAALTELAAEPALATLAELTAEPTLTELAAEPALAALAELANDTTLGKRGRCVREGEPEGEHPGERKFEPNAIHEIPRESRSLVPHLTG
jgi:hypothetical protein